MRGEGLAKCCQGRQGERKRAEMLQRVVRASSAARELLAQRRRLFSTVATEEVGLTPREVRGGGGGREDGRGRQMGGKTRGSEGWKGPCGEKAGVTERAGGGEVG